VLDRYPLAAFVAPGLQDQPASLCFHPLTKSMRFCAVPVVGLVSSLWHDRELLENLKL